MNSIFRNIFAHSAKYRSSPSLTHRLREYLPYLSPILSYSIIFCSYHFPNSIFFVVCIILHSVHSVLLEWFSTYSTLYLHTILWFTCTILDILNFASVVLFSTYFILFCLCGSPHTLLCLTCSNIQTLDFVWIVPFSTYSTLIRACYSAHTPLCLIRVILHLLLFSTHSTLFLFLLFFTLSTLFRRCHSQRQY